jgi:hypothetical protein
MISQTAGKKTVKPGNRRKAAARKNDKDGFATIDSYLPAGSPQRTAAGIAVAAAAALLAAAVVGTGPAALAGATGYLVYRGTNA